MYCFYFLLWVGRLRSNNNATIPFTFVCPTLWTNQTAEFFFERKYLFGIIFCTDLDIWGSNKIVKWFLSFCFVTFSPPNTLHCFDFLHWFGYLRRRWQMTEWCLWCWSVHFSASQIVQLFKEQYMIMWLFFRYILKSLYSA